MVAPFSPDSLPTPVDPAQSVDPAGLLDTSSAATPFVDVESIDLGVRAIRQVEQSWGMPALPDEVKLDLASSSGLGPGEMAGFLNGLRADMVQSRQEERRSGLPVSTTSGGDPQPSAPVDAPGAPDPGTLQKLRVFYAGFAGLPQPKELKFDAVQRFKRRAVDLGYLPEGTKIDGRWTPELNGVRYEILKDDFARRIQGKRPGAVSISQVAQVMDDWLSPTGLLDAAVTLDFIPDFEEVGKEAAAWGDKWRRWFANPTSPRDFIDAVTGPIDDIALPLINDALLFSGVSEMYMFGRTALGVGRGLQAAEMAEVAFTGARAVSLAERVPLLGRVVSSPLLKAASTAEDLTHLSRPSFLAEKFLASDRSLFQALGGRMAAWRSNTSVLLARKAVQQTGRLGLASRTEDLLLPNRERGLSLGDVGAVDRAVDRVRSSPWGYGVGEILFTPTSILEPGSLARVTRGLGEGLRKGVFWSGALEQVPENPARFNEFRDGVTDFLADAAPERLADFEKSAKEVGEVQAMADLFTGGDKGELGAMMTYLATTQALHARALEGAAGVALSEDVMRVHGSKKAMDMYYLLRNKGIMQLRSINADDVNQVALSLAARSGDTPQVTERLFETWRRALSSGEVATFQEVQDVHARLQRTLQKGSIRGQKGLVERLTAFARKPEAAKDLGLDLVGDVGRGEARLGAALKGQVTDRKISEFGVSRAAMLGGGAGLDPAKLPSLGRADEFLSRTVETASGRQAVMRDLWGPKMASTHPDLAEEWGSIVSDLTEELASSGVVADQARYLEHVRGPVRQVLDAELERLGVVKKNVGLAVEAHNRSRAKFARELLDAQTKPGRLREYTARALAAQGEWTAFTEADDMVASAVEAGDLVGARWLQAVSPESAVIPTEVGVVPDAGRRLAQVGGEAGKFEGSDFMANTWEAVLSDPFTAAGLKTGLYNPLSTPINPNRGLFTVARKTSASAQSAMQDVAFGEKLLRVDTAMRQVEGTAPWRRALAAFPNPGEHERPFFHAVIAELAADTAEEGLLPNLGRVLRYAQVNDIPLADVAEHSKAALAAFDDSPVWSKVYGIGADVVGVDRKVKELRQRARYLAREVDHSSIPKDLARFLDERGYKLVHGRQFLSPRDVFDMVEPLKEVSQKARRTRSLGAWFSRKDPGAIGSLMARARRSALQEELSKVATSLDVSSPHTKDMDLLLGDLHEVLAEFSRDGEFVKSLKADQGVFRRLVTNVQLSTVPNMLEDLSLGVHEKKFFRLMRTSGRVEYSDQEIRAIWRALKRSRHLGPQAHGLFAIETHLRANPQLTGLLRGLSKVEVGGGLSTGRKLTAKGVAVGTKLTPAIIGGALAAQNVAATDPEGFQLGFNHQMVAALSGAAGGVLVGSKAVRKIAETGLLGDVVEGAGRLGRLADRWDASKWAKYAYLADNLAYMRDFFRFSVSPIFDISRYTEGTVLAQISDLPDGVTLHLDQSPSGWRRRAAKAAREVGYTAEEAKQYAAGQWDSVVSEFQAAARGDFDWQATEATSKWFTDVGIMGFNPTEWMAAMFGSLRRADVAPDRAYEIVRDAYTYGVRGRSSAELSANFVFFPFSFMKKTLGHVRKFMAKDLSRAIIFHDALKQYDVLNERYDLSQRFRDHLPLLERFQRLNLLAYGVSPGEFGGPNRPLINAFISTPIADGTTSPIMNLFLPQAVEIKSGGDALAVQQLTRRLLPVINDISAMTEDLQSQGHVLFASSHITKEAEVNRAYAEWNEVKSLVDQVLKESGAAGWVALSRIKSPGADRLRAYVAAQRAHIASKYPAWQDYRAELVGHRQALDFERQDRLARFEVGESQDPRDIALSQMTQLEDLVQERLRDTGISLTSNPEDVPVAIFDAFRKVGVELSRKYPGFELDWIKFFRSRWGPIGAELYG